MVNYSPNRVKYLDETITYRFNQKITWRRWNSQGGEELNGGSTKVRI